MHCHPHRSPVLTAILVDYNKLAEQTGMTNPRSASNAWAQIKKKIAVKGGITKDKDTNGTAENGGSEAGTPKPKGTPRKRGKKADAEDGDGDGASPTKKKKATPKKKAAKSEDTAEEDAGAVESPDGVVKAEEGEDDLLS